MLKTLQSVGDLGLVWGGLDWVGLDVATGEVPPSLTFPEFLRFLVHGFAFTLFFKVLFVHDNSPEVRDGKSSEVEGFCHGLGGIFGHDGQAGASSLLQRAAPQRI